MVRSLKSILSTWLLFWDAIVSDVTRLSDGTMLNSSLCSADYNAYMYYFSVEEQVMRALIFCFSRVFDPTNFCSRFLYVGAENTRLVITLSILDFPVLVAKSLYFIFLTDLHRRNRLSSYALTMLEAEWCSVTVYFGQCCRLLRFFSKVLSLCEWILCLLCSRFSARLKLAGSNWIV